MTANLARSVSFVLPGAVWVPSGSYRVVYEHANRLVARGHRVEIRYLAGSGNLAIDLRRHLRGHGRGPNWFPLDPLISIRHQRRLHEGDLDADAVVACSWQVAETLADYWPSAARRFYLVHHYEGDKYPPDRVDATLRADVQKIVVSSSTLAALEARGVERIVHVPNGVDTDVFRASNPPEDRPLQVAMNYVPKASKDPATGFEAIALTRRVVGDARFVAFGAAPLDARWKDEVRYFRALSTPRLVRLYNDSAIFLSSSRMEGFGLPLLEAMACGCAVVTTDSGGNRDYVTDGVNALVTPAGDATALADALVAALGDDGLRRSLAQAGVETARRFSWETSTDLLEHVLFGDEND